MSPMSDCLICAHVKIHGSWPGGLRGTHCQKCCRSWSSTREVHCVGCCSHFVAYSAFDMHLRGRWTMEHLDPAMVEGLERVEGPGSGVWRCRQSEGQRSWIAAQRAQSGSTQGQNSPAKAEVTYMAPQTALRASWGACAVWPSAMPQTLRKPWSASHEPAQEPRNSPSQGIPHPGWKPWETPA